MKAFDIAEMTSLLAKILSKPCMYISIVHWDYLDDIFKAAPYLNMNEHAQIISDGVGIIVFNSEAEMNEIYGQTVGDDGPTNSNPYNGPGRVYALTCGPD